MDTNLTDRIQEATSSASEEIIRIPASLDDFCQQLRNRIEHQSPHSVCSEDHDAMVTVIMSEVSLVWRDLCRLPKDPMLTLEENRCLRRRTFAKVLCICEQLYFHYLHWLGVLQKHGNFSQQANRCRVAAQLASDVSRLLNVHSIKRSIAVGIKATRKNGISDVKPDAANLDTFLRLPPCSNNQVARNQQKKTVEQDLQEIQEKIGDLELELTNDLYSPPELITRKTEAHCSSKPAMAVEEVDEWIYEKHITKLKGCHSMPNLQRETLLEESLMVKLPVRSHSTCVLLSGDMEKHIDPAEDLRRLVQDTDSVDKSEADLPPLIRASNCNGSSRLQRLTYMLQRLDQEEKQMMKSQIEVAGPQLPQAAVASVSVSSQSVARTAESRVADRVLSETVNISLNPPVYNDLTGEIDPLWAQRFDQNLFVGTEIKALYKELSKSITTDYFSFDEDSMIEPAMSNADLPPSLKRSHEKKLLNTSLCVPYVRSESHSRKRTELAVDRKRPADMTSHAYATWYKWWKANITVDDYLNYISNQESDYLSVVFHLYDSDSSDEDGERKRILQMERENRRKQQENRNTLKSQKQAYVPGLWNVNTVLMGGLWKEPMSENVKQPDVEHPQMAGMEDCSFSGAGPVNGPQMQARLLRVWSLLCLSETERLDMAIKYSSHAHRDQLEKAIAAWEQAAQLIQQRELLLSQLEEFERMASDPKRFFQQGPRGNSLTRMKEASHREKLQSKIAALDKILSKCIHHISSSFNDIVTYKGRPYGEKMRWDRIEMLYWLQQERRVQALHQLMEGSGQLPARLPPLNHDHRLSSGSLELSFERHSSQTTCKLQRVASLSQGRDAVVAPEDEPSLQTFLPLEQPSCACVTLGLDGRHHQSQTRVTAVAPLKHRQSC